MFGYSSRSEKNSRCPTTSNRAGGVGGDARGPDATIDQGDLAGEVTGAESPDAAPSRSTPSEPSITMKNS